MDTLLDCQRRDKVADICIRQRFSMTTHSPLPQPPDQLSLAVRWDARR